MTNTSEHSSICTGRHNQYGECIRSHRIAGTITVELNALPEDHAYIEIGGHVSDAAELDRLIARLQQMRPLLDTAAKEA